MDSNDAQLECRCDKEKTHLLVFDGGSSGAYLVCLCNDCYCSADKRFMISEDNPKIKIKIGDQK